MSVRFSESTAIAISTYNMVAYTQKRAADSQEVSPAAINPSLLHVHLCPSSLSLSLSFSLSLPPSLPPSLSHSQMMDFLQQREWGLMILDGELHFHLLITVEVAFIYFLHLFVSKEVQTCPADKFRRTLSGMMQACMGMTIVLISSLPPPSPSLLSLPLSLSPLQLFKPTPS